jgi:hypothetical protein
MPSLLMDRQLLYVHKNVSEGLIFVLKYNYTAHAYL